jgi:hypothetical protein
VVPLFDKVISECDEAIEQSKNTFINSNERPLQHGLEQNDLDATIGSDLHDVGRAILTGGEEVKVDEQRQAVDKIVGLATANAEEVFKFRMKKIVNAFQLHENDFGSPQVQCKEHYDARIIYM